MRKVTGIFLLSALLGLSACGENGDDRVAGAAPNYQGTATLAVFNGTNASDAADLAAAAVTGMTLAMQPFTYVGEEAEIFPQFIFYLVYGAREGMRGPLNKTNSVSQTESFFLNGGCGGTASVSLTTGVVWDDETETGQYSRSGTVTFDNYSDWGDCYDSGDLLPDTDGAVVNGTFYFTTRESGTDIGFSGVEEYGFNNLTLFYPEWDNIPMRSAAQAVPPGHSATGWMVECSGTIPSSYSEPFDGFALERSEIHLSRNIKYIGGNETELVESHLWNLTVTRDEENHSGQDVTGNVCVNGLGCVNVSTADDGDGPYYPYYDWYSYQPWDEGAIEIDGAGGSNAWVDLLGYDWPYGWFDVSLSEDGGVTYIDTWRYMGYGYDLYWEL